MHEPPAAAENAIEIRIDDISQLFHTLDPFPFRERDLDKDAEEFIVSWARELPADQPFRIAVHLPEAQASIPETYEIAAAITGYFGYRARITMLDLKELFRVGWRALAIGLTVLSFSVIIGQTVVVNLAPRPVGRVIEESLLIFGWVANWKPIEIFLYEWWPIVRRRNLYQRLAAAQVELKPYRRDERGRTLAFDPCPYRKHRTNSAQSRALEKKGLGENEWRFYTVGTVHSLVRRIRPLLKICAAPTGRRIL